MGIKSDKAIYRLIEQKLSDENRPMTCNELMDDPAIRAEAISLYGDDVQSTTNKLSDIVGFMWRRGVLMRYPAPKTSTSFARYAYGWIQAKDDGVLRAVPPPVRLKTKSLIGVVEHDDCVEIEFEKFIIYVKPKK